MSFDDQPETVRACYRRLTPPQLVTLRQAFILDAAATDSPLVRSFCEERMRVIGEVLKEASARKARRRAGREAARPPAGAKEEG